MHTQYTYIRESRYCGNKDKKAETKFEPNLGVINFIEE